MMFKTAPS